MEGGGSPLYNRGIQSTRGMIKDRIRTRKVKMTDLMDLFRARGTSSLDFPQVLSKTGGRVAYVF